MAAIPKEAQESRDNPWRAFKSGPWKTRINVRDFIQRNYTPYVGDASFLAGPTARTRKVWEKLLPLIAEETRERRARRVAGALQHRRARSRLHRPRPRAHRRPPDRRAAEARDHAEGRLEGRRGEPQGLWLRAGCPDRQDLHHVRQDAQRRRLRCVHPGDPQVPQVRDRHRAARRLWPRPADHRRLSPPRALRPRFPRQGEARRARRAGRPALRPRT